MRAGAGCSSAAALLIGTSWIAGAADIRIPKPEGWQTREHLVAVRGDRYAVALYNPRSSKQGSILIQGHGEETVRTELQGTIMHMELAATGRHVALMRTVRDPGGRGLGAVMELLDGGGTVRQVAGSGAASRFSTSGQVLYRPIEDEDGLFRSVAIFDLTGEPVETLELGRPFSDVLVIGNGKELVVLRSPGAESATRGGGKGGKGDEDDESALRPVTLTRIRARQPDTPLWTLAFDPQPAHLTGNMLRSLDEGSFLLLLESGRLGWVSLKGKVLHEHDPASGAVVAAAGPRPGSLVLQHSDRVALLDAETGRLSEPAAGTENGFVADGRLVRDLGAELVIEDIDWERRIEDKWPDTP